MDGLNEGDASPRGALEVSGAQLAAAPPGPELEDGALRDQLAWP